MKGNEDHQPRALGADPKRSTVYETGTAPDSYDANGLSNTIYDSLRAQQLRDQQDGIYQPLDPGEHV